MSLSGFSAGRVPDAFIVGSLVLLLIGVGGLVLSQTGRAQPSEMPEAKTVEVTYRVYAGDKTPEEAREQAVERAQAEAVRRVVGTQVQAERVASSVQAGEDRIERFAQIVRTGASGRVVDYEVLEESRPERAGMVFQKVRLSATVVPEQGQSDPAFEVRMRLNEEDGVYLDRGAPRESQELVVEMTATKDAYLTVLNVTPDTINVAWPNARMKDTFVPADSTVEFPPTDMRRLGLRWRVNVPAGRSSVTERIVVVATKVDVPFRPVPNWEVDDGQLKTAGASIDALNRWLVEIPLDQRALVTRTYTVKRAPQD